jgi:beta-galactosidase
MYYIYSVNAADTTRPITANTEWGLGSADTLTTVLDVVTCSYNYATYELYHKHHPFRPFMGGESASCYSDRGYYGGEYIYICFLLHCITEYFTKL